MNGGVDVACFLISLTAGVSAVDHPPPAFGITLINLREDLSLPAFVLFPGLHHTKPAVSAEDQHMHQGVVRAHTVFGPEIIKGKLSISRVAQGLVMKRWGLRHIVKLPQVGRISYTIQGK